MEMYGEGFWLPLLAVIAVILLSLFEFTKLFNNKTNTTTVADEKTSESETSSSNPNSSSTSNPVPSAPYEVFLSFRGPDTRYGFTDFLYNDLDDARIRTFRDDNELRKGEEIGPELLRAITESKISIPIFSKNYASSKWCLRELAKMWECRKSMGQIILPIFFDVQPSDLRHQTGTYKEAFIEHERRFDDETLRGWREALRGVGALKGWELKKETGGHQGKLVKMVVSKVLLELKKNYMVVTDSLVAINHHIEEISRLLDFHSSDVRIVGIHGMGGLGKTTIAKVIYNTLSKSFEHCSFLADVRESSQQKGLVNLQIQLNTKILKRKGLDIDNVDEGIQMTKDTVFGKKVLIVLDDVAQSSQFEVLVGKRDWYGLGSRIIVTTRNKKVLDDLEVDGAYEPPTMEPYYSLQLFSKHAFRQDFPPEDYDLLSKEVASTAAGLPLALEIIGSLLYGKGKAVWKDTLKKLRKRPDDQVQAILRISYEALDYEQKQIFLDVACLPIGMDKETAEIAGIPVGMDKENAFYMWDACEFFPESGIEVLVLMSLVKIRNDILWMHDQLIGLGREIVHKENFKNPGKRSRLWSHEEALDVLEWRKGTEKVEAFCLDFKLEYQGLCFTSKVFTELPNLRFLKVDCAELTGDFKHLLSKLRWLHWRKCPGKFTPTNFYPKNLVILDLSGSSVTNDWQAWSQIKMAVKLKVLDLSFCNCLTRTPDFSRFASLERLILRGCKSMTHIESSIGNLISLRVLDISQSAITKLPDAIGNLEDLEMIDAFCCSLQGEIPSSIGRLSSLRILRLNSTKICHLPTSICGLSCLQTLDLLCCNELPSLPQLPPSLTRLRVTFKEMESFPSLPNLMSLEKLYLYQCPNLLEVDVRNLFKLKTLSLYTVGIRTLPTEVGGLYGLKKLKIWFCENLHCIMGLPSGLLKLSVEHRKSLQRLPGLSNLKILSELKVLNCAELIIEIRGLEKLELLTSLHVSICEQVRELGGLEQLKSLRYMNIMECPFLKTLPDLSNLKKLQNLLAMGCLDLIDIQGLQRLESLEYVDISECMSIEKLPDLSNLGMLKELVLRKCDSLDGTGGILVSKSLERLDISYCKWLKGLPDLSNLKNLKELKICGWDKLIDTQGLVKLKSLELLYIADCKSVEKLLNMSNLISLITLIAYGCVKLTEIRGLEELKSLRLLEITGCELIEKLPNLTNTENTQAFTSSAALDISPVASYLMAWYHGAD